MMRACCILFATLSVSSCENYFELDRPIQFPWQNSTELELAVREGYLHLSNDPWFNPMGALSMIGFGQSDIARLLPEAIQGNNYATQYYNRTYATAPSDKEVAETFKFLYYIITNNNAALQMLNDAESAGKDPFEGMVAADRERVQRYKGELYFSVILTERLLILRRLTCFLSSPSISKLKLLNDKTKQKLPSLEEVRISQLQKEDWIFASAFCCRARSGSHLLTGAISGGKALPVT